MGILLLLSMGSEFHICKISTSYFEDNKSLSKLKAALPWARQGGGHQPFCLSRNTSWVASPCSQAIRKFRDVQCLAQCFFSDGETHAAKVNKLPEELFICWDLTLWFQPWICCVLQNTLEGLEGTITAQNTWKQQLQASVIANKHHQSHHAGHYGVSTFPQQNSCCAIATRARCPSGTYNPAKSLGSLHRYTEDNKLNLQKSSCNH